MHVLKTRGELALFLEEQRMHRRSVGLVPTMGALHNGHLSLIAQSTVENDLTVCSIFVNPTQFNDPHDLERYPRPVDSDLAKLRLTSCDAVFLPEVTEMYPGGENWHVDLGGLEDVLEGKFRPGHYQGVTQVVKKFFDLVKPDRAYFGQKDYQQFLVIGRMVRAFSIPVALVCCPTMREPDGLAMSSRNVHLAPGERTEAALLSKALFLIRDVARSSGPAEARSKALDLLTSSALIRVEYLEIADAATLRPVRSWEDAPGIIALAAIRIGQTRLIDNVFIKQSR